MLLLLLLRRLALLRRPACELGLLCLAWFVLQSEKSCFNDTIESKGTVFYGAHVIENDLKV